MEGFAIGRPARPLEEVSLWLRAFTQYWEGRMSALGRVLDEEEGDG